MLVYHAWSPSQNKAKIKSCSNTVYNKENEVIQKEQDENQRPGPIQSFLC